LGGGSGSSQATWFLERRFREEYGSHLSVRGAAGEAPVRIEAELKIAEAIRANPEAVKKIHEAMMLALADDEKRRSKSAAKSRRESRRKRAP
jgi:hypothetical protein